MNANAILNLKPIALDDAHPTVAAILEDAKSRLGFVPNLYGAMGNSPGLLEAYVNGSTAFREGSGFTPVEQEVIFLTISRENRCSYCVAVHSVIADSRSKVPHDVTEAIRDHRPVGDLRLEVLSAFTRTMVASRGNPTLDDIAAFVAVGYSKRQVLEIVLAIAVKTISNYTNHLVATTLDEPFASRAWRGATGQMTEEPGSVGEHR